MHSPRDCGIDATFWCADVYDASRRPSSGRTLRHRLHRDRRARHGSRISARGPRSSPSSCAPMASSTCVEIHPIGPWRARRRSHVDAGHLRGRRSFRGTSRRRNVRRSRCARCEHTTSMERVHAISDVISAVLEGAVSRLELFHEQSYTNAPWPWAERRRRRLLPTPRRMAEVPAAPTRSGVRVLRP